MERQPPGRVESQGVLSSAGICETGVVEDRRRAQQTLPRNSGVKDFQCAWLLFLYCGVARANFQFRTVHPELTKEFSQRTRTGDAKFETVNECGASLKVARRRKERRHPELVGDRGRAQLVVIIGEVGGQFSAETAQFLTGLVSNKVREFPELLRGRAHAVWLRRWSSLLVCAAAPQQEWMATFSTQEVMSADRAQ